MAERYRSWTQRRDIIRAVIAETNPAALDTFQLTPGEVVFYRARAARALDALAQKTSAFRAYYALPVARPFKQVLYVSGAMIAVALAAVVYLYIQSPKATDPTPMFTAFVGVTVAAVGWAVSGGIAHRNAIRQHTNTILFARFAQATFGEALHRFHTAFGGPRSTERVTPDRVKALRASGTEEDLKALASMGYLLNYYEFIASGVLQGDLNSDIVRNNIRGIICYFYDKCEPHILDLSKANPKTFENLIKIRTHYREP